MAVITGDEFRIPITVDDKATRALKDVEKNAKKSSGGFSSLQASIVTANQAFALLGRTIDFVSDAIAGLITDFAEFETALVGVGKTANLSGSELEALGDEFLRLSEEIPTTATELANIGQTAGQLGVSGSANILKFTETIANLAQASDLAGEAGATALARILNITDGGVQNIDKFASAIVGLGNQFAATESEIANVATEVARSTSVFELGAANVAGLSTALKALGIQAQLGGSVVGKAFRTIDMAVRQGGDTLEALEEITQMTGEQLRKSFQEDATKTFQVFIEGLGRLSDENKSVSAALEDLGLSGDEVNKILPVLAQRTDLVAEALKVANEEFDRNAALTEEAAKANSTLQAEWQKLTNVITNSSIEFGESLAPTLKEIIITLRKGLVDAIQFTNKVWDSFTTALDGVDFGKLIENFKNFGIALAAIASPAIITALASLSGILIGIVAPVALLAIKFALIGVAVITVAAAFDILIRNMDKSDRVIDLFADTFILALQGVGLAFVKLGQLILETIQTGLQAVAKFDKFSKIALGAAKVIEKGMSGLINEQHDLTQAIGETTDSIAKNAEKLDLGFVGAAIEEGTKFLEGFNKELNTSRKTTQGLGKDMEKVAKEVPKTLEITTVFKEAKVELFSKDDLELIAGAFGQAAARMGQTISNFLKPFTTFLGAANLILDAIKGLIDSIPNLLNKVADVIFALTDLPEKIAEGVDRILESVTKFIRNFFNKLVDSVGDILESLADFLAEDLDKVILDLVERIPDALNRLFDRLPEIVEKLGQALVRLNFAILATRFAVALIRNMPDIAKALVRAMFTEIPLLAKAFVDGIITAFKEIVNEIANAFGAEDVFNIGVDVDELKDQIKSIGDEITRSSSQLFQVIDLEAQARGLDVADRIRDAISSGTTGLVTAWDRIIAALRAAWEWVVDRLTALWNGLTDIWLFVRDEIFNVFFEKLREFRDFLVDRLFEVIEFMSNIWTFAQENVVDPLINGLGSIWNFVKNSVVEPLLDGLDSIWSWVRKHVVKPIMGSMDWVDDLDDIVGDLFKTPGWVKSFSNAVDDLSALGFSGGGIVGSAQKKLQDLGAKAADNFKRSDAGKIVSGFADGGMVPMGKYLNGLLYAQQGAFAAQGTDTVPAVLTPGEFVVNREATRANLGLLSTINQQKGKTLVPAQSPVSISVVINAKTDLSPGQIRREVIPTLEQELKRKSQEGKFVIANTGVRTNR